MFIVFWERESWVNPHETLREWTVAISEAKAKQRLDEVLQRHSDFVVKHGIAKIMEEHTLFDRL